MIPLGDYKFQQTIRFKWPTSDAAGASITRGTDGTIKVYKDDSTSPSTAGITDTEDFNSLTGVHHCKIVTTDSFYEKHHDYQVVLEGAGIDAATVNHPIAHFSILNRPRPRVMVQAVSLTLLLQPAAQAVLPVVATVTHLALPIGGGGFVLQTGVDLYTTRRGPRSFGPRGRHFRRDQP